MSNLPVREMVLYKHGVGFFVREGEIEGTSATLTFRADEVNDILKSLAVFDRAGGQVHGVHYQTPMDKKHRLENTSIVLSDFNSFTQLIQQIRGRNAKLLIEKNEDTMTYEGRVIGVEKRAYDEGQRTFVAIQLEDEMIRQFLVDDVSGFMIHDEQSKQDLSYFLDTSMSEDNRRGVTISLSEGEHELVVYYVAPSPTWRVSYRLVAESDDDGNTGTALLQGWGLFDNRLEEDLKDVRVTLVAGQPISFIYDLYESKIPNRPIVKDEARTVQKPVEYKSTNTDLPAARIKRRTASGSGREQGLLGRIDKSVVTEASPPQPIDDGLSIADQMGTVQSSADTSQGGTTFQYIVNAPVSVKRGESALVPIINEKVPYERELLYNNTKFPSHPVASIRFENQSGLTLERGPVTVIEDNAYAGEAIIPFVGDKRSVYVPYAVELGLTVDETYKTGEVVRGLSVEGRFLVEQVHGNSITTYIIENSTDTDKVVTIEAEKRKEYDLFDTPAPDVDLLKEYRWHVDIPAHERVTFVKSERQLRSNRFNIRGFSNRTLQQYMENKYLDNALLNDLAEIMTTFDSIKDIQKSIDKLTVEKGELFGKQEEYRRNMKALGTTGKEGELRLRAVNQLEAAQDRIDAIETEIVALKDKITATEKQVDDMITELGKAYSTETNET